jgi:hypothetical protein
VPSPIKRITFLALEGTSFFDVCDAQVNDVANSIK